MSQQVVEMEQKAGPEVVSTEQKVGQALNGAARALIEHAQKFLEEHPLHKVRNGPDRTALRNLVDTASVASCLEEVCLFVQYQVGRDYRKWNPEGSKEFGQHLVTVLGVKGALDELAQRTLGGLGLAEPRRDRARAELAARWLGFLLRRFRYLQALDKTSAPAAPRDARRDERGSNKGGRR